MNLQSFSMSSRLIYVVVMEASIIILSPALSIFTRVRGSQERLFRILTLLISFIISAAEISKRTGGLRGLRGLQDFQTRKKRAPWGLFTQIIIIQYIRCPCNIYTCANRISMRLIFDLHTRVRILKSLSCDPRTRVNIARAAN